MDTENQGKVIHRLENFNGCLHQKEKKRNNVKNPLKKYQSGAVCVWRT